MNRERYISLTIKTYLIISFLALLGCQQSPNEPEAAGTGSVTPPAVELSDEQIEDIVRRSYQYVATYNVAHKGTFDTNNPLAAGGVNRVVANTRLADHTVQFIARPNNDTLYTAALLDLTREPVILEMPAFDSKYVSLMVTGYDHYVTVPMSTRLGDFSAAARILLYSARTPGYAGEAVEGVDKVAEMTGDFVSALFRVMPHANEPERMQRNLQAMQDIKVLTLSEFQTGSAIPVASPAEFPDFGLTDFDIFENNLLEVMQFVLNHTTFKPDDELDQKLLAVYEPLGVVPGQDYEPSSVAKIDGARFGAVAQRIAQQQLVKANDPAFVAENGLSLYLPKGQMTLERLLFQSAIGPLGQPAAEAVYPVIATTDGVPMNAMNDYVIRMGADELPPGSAFWSFTLYDSENGFFIPNDQKKYSVGENAGMRMDEDGGIAIHIAAKQPAGVPEENWLPLVRGDYGIDVILRIYVPDLARSASWAPPKAEIDD